MYYYMLIVLENIILLLGCLNTVLCELLNALGVNLLNIIVEGGSLLKRDELSGVLGELVCVSYTVPPFDKKR